MKDVPWSKVCMILSVIAVVLSGIVSLGIMEELWLAGTQWILIGIVLGIWGLFLKK